MWKKAEKRVEELEEALDWVDEQLSLEREKVKGLDKLLEECRGRLSVETEARRVASDELAKARETIAKQEVLIREQTEADLLLNALKAVGVIREEKPVDPRFYFERDAQLRANSAMQSQQAGLLDLLGGFR